MIKYILVLLTLFSFQADAFLSGPVNASQLQGTNVSATPPTDTQCLVYSSGSSAWIPSSCSGGGGGGVTSVGLLLPASVFTISGSPVTTSGTLTGTFATQLANTVFAGPTSGGAATPAFRALGATDIPALSYVSSIGVTAPVASSGGLTPTISMAASSNSVDGYLTAADHTSFAAKQAAGNYITALTGDVTASGPGSVAATVASVGGSTASAVNTATVLANAATASNTLGAIVKRDGTTGGFAAGMATISDFQTTLSPVVNSSASPRLSLVTAADTNLTASTDANMIYWNLAGTRTHATGDLAVQRDVRITPATHAYNGTSNITSMTTFSVDGPPVGGTNAVVTDANAVRIVGGATANATNSYGLRLSAPTGAVNNYAASFMGGSVGIGTVSPTKTLDVTGTANLTGTSTAEFTVGQNGATNPAFQIDSNTASSVTGVKLTSNIAGSGVTLASISSATDESINIMSKGAGTVQLAPSTNTRLQVGNTATTSSTGTSSTSNPHFGWTGAADTTLTASTDMNAVYFNLGQSRQHATGTLTLQRDLRVTPSTHTFVGASALTDTATLSIDGPPVCGTNATCTNAHALYIPTSALTNTTNGYGLSVAATTGATNNYAAQFSGSTFVTSNSANSFVVGPSGLTNPALQVDSSAASAVAGLLITEGASGSGVSLTTISSASNEGITINSKGNGSVVINNPSTTGTVSLRTASAARLAVTGSTFVYTPTTNTGTSTRFSYTGASDVTLGASTETNSWYINLGQTRQHSTGAITTQRDFRYTPTTHSFVGASAITDAMGISIDGPPVGGTNATITNTHSLYVGSTATANATNSYGLTVNASSGAGTNYAAQFIGGNVGIGIATPSAPLAVSGHMHFAGTTPAVANGAGDCGTSPAIVGNDNLGRVTVGSAANGGVCTITFATTWTNAPICMVNDETTGVLTRATNVSTTSFKITGVVVAGDSVTYRCAGYQ